MCDCDICKSLDDLRRRHQQAVDDKIAAGHEDDPDCQCRPCVAERNSWFMLEHAHDDDCTPPVHLVEPADHLVEPVDDSVRLTEDEAEIPF